jgi:hypothetical protein
MFTLTEDQLIDIAQAAFHRGNVAFSKDYHTFAKSEWERYWGIKFPIDNVVLVKEFIKKFEQESNAPKKTLPINSTPDVVDDNGQYSDSILAWS